MSLGHGASIVRDGLVLHLDAANPKSYPGTGTTWSDISGLGNNGTLVNGVGYSTDNKGAIAFDGVDDLIDCGTSSTLNLTSNLSISVWIYPVGFGESNFGRIIERNLNGTSGYAVLVDNDGSIGGAGAINGITFSVNNAGVGSISRFSNSVILNTWQHFVFALSSNTIFLYKNGQLFGSSSISLPSSVNTNFYVGNRAATDRTFNGRIAQVMLYNRALSAAEVKQNFEALRGRYGI